MSTTPIILTTTFDAAPIVDALLGIDEQIAQLEAQRTALRGVLAQNLPIGTAEVNGHEVQVSVRRTLNAARFAQRYPVTSHPVFYTSKPDTKAIKQHLAPADIGDLYDVSAPIVSVKS